MIQSTQNTQLHPKISELIIKRYENIEDFMSWDLKNIPELTNLIDIEKTSTRIIDAINNEEKIGIYGDYDVDGTTSCALFYRFFEMLGVEVQMIQPSRFVEGYGVHKSSIDDAISKGINLLITVDCGITNVETAVYSHGFQNFDLIITDHHKDAADVIPPAYSVVNPNRRDEEDGPLQKLAGVGVAFCICLQVKKDLEAKNEKIPTIYPLLQYVAIGTICDLAHLNSLNLRLCRHGLKQLKETTYNGLKAFLTPEDRIDHLVLSEKVGFLIGPMINSKGRLEHPELALKLLVEDDYQLARHYFLQLKDCNNQRKKIQSDVVAEAKAQLLESDLDSDFISIAYDPSWHEGVIGIVASRVVEVFKKPAIIFTDSEQEGIIKASARSAGELDLFSLLQDCSDLFLKFGGHKAAAGLSMKKENLAALKTKLNHALKDVPENLRTKVSYYDLHLELNDLDPYFMNSLKQMEPFGMGNERPKSKIGNLKVDSFKILKEKHIKWFFSDLNGQRKIGGISFNYFDKWNSLHPEEIVHSQDENGIHVIGEVSLNRFNGNETIQIMVNELHFGQI